MKIQGGTTEEWGNGLLNEINLTEFYRKTSPIYHVGHCQFEHVDCRRMWHLKRTRMGTCLEFDPTLAVRLYKKTVEATMVKGGYII